MKALSVRQPWSWLIVNGHKDVENRTWPPTKYISVPQRIYIHTGAKPDDSYGFRQAQTMLSVVYGEEKAREIWLSYCDVPLRAIVGEVDIVGFERHSQSLWAVNGSYHWQLANPVAYSEPIPYRGQLGLFEVTL